MNKFKDKAIIVTGATGAVGTAVVKKLIKSEAAAANYTVARPRDLDPVWSSARNGASVLSDLSIPRAKKRQTAHHAGPQTHAE